MLAVWSSVGETSAHLERAQAGPRGLLLQALGGEPVELDHLEFGLLPGAGSAVRLLGVLDLPFELDPDPAAADAHPGRAAAVGAPP